MLWYRPPSSGIAEISPLTNSQTYYVVYIFLMAGLTGNVNLLASGVQYALFIVFTTVMVSRVLSEQPFYCCND